MKSIIIYYSNSGTTEKLAKKIQESFGGELAEVKADVPYGSYFAAVKRAGGELRKGVIADYTGPQLDVSGVDTVFVGYPIWYSNAPAFLLDYISKMDLTGKRVIPFSTSGATNIKATLQKVQAAASGAEVVCPYNCGMFSKDDYDSWVKEVGGTAQ